MSYNTILPTELAWHDERRWCAEYQDGTLVDEADRSASDGELRGFAEVDPARTVALHLRAADSAQPVLSVLIPEGCRPYFGRDRKALLEGDTNAVLGQASIDVLGFQTQGTPDDADNTGREPQGVYLFVLPDGRVVLSQGRDAVSVQAG